MGKIGLDDIELDNNEIVKKYIICSISEDNLEGYINICDGTKTYTLDEIKEYLSEYGIVKGINVELIKSILDEKRYYEEICIANGKNAIDGKDGYYEFFFDTQPTKKPIILEDGSVDYNTLGQIELCSVGDKLAIYHKSVQGKNGFDVYGNILYAKVGTDLKPLKGKDFTLLEEENIYIANSEGKVELKDNKIIITPIFLMDGDVDAATGDIIFKGDVVVSGNVYSNVTIEATGNITVNGHVETATLIAGKDVILRNGMQGSGKGCIYAKGDVSAKFFEQTIIKSEGNVNANIIMNCDIEANGKVLVSGKRGAIIGGITKAIEGITASMVGNRAGANTTLCIGPQIDTKKEFSKIDEEISNFTNELDEITRKLNNIMEKLMKNPNAILQQTKNELMRKKIGLSANIKENIKIKNELIDKLERSKNGTIIVHGVLNPNTCVKIDIADKVITTECRNVTLKRKNKEINIYYNNI